MDHSLQAAQLFLQGYNCAQAITVAFSDVTGLDKTFSAKMASSLAAAWVACGRFAVRSAVC